MVVGESLFSPGAGLDPEVISAGLPLDLVAGLIRGVAEGVAGMSSITVEPLDDSIPTDRAASFRLRALLSLPDRANDLRVEETITLDLIG
jgi:hypothetical protein